tara:strand:+ start:1142 stop:1264 length:123 start_codon:yes stop_codon:yes gene_type:complete
MNDEFYEKKTDKEDSKFDAIVAIVVILAVTAAIVLYVSSQ